MVKKVKSEKIPGIGKGRRAYSKDTELSTIPFVRKHQARISTRGKGRPSDPIPPGENEVVAGILPNRYRDHILQYRKYDAKTSGNHLWKFRFGWGNFDLAVAGYPPSVYIDYYFGKIYGYGEAELKAKEGISFNLFDEPSSYFYPDYLKHCVFMVAENKTDHPLQPIFYTAWTGFVSIMK